MIIQNSVEVFSIFKQKEDRLSWIMKIIILHL